MTKVGLRWGYKNIALGLQRDYKKRRLDYKNRCSDYDGITKKSVEITKRLQKKPSGL